MAAAVQPASRLRVLAHPGRLAINGALQARDGAPASVRELTGAVGLPAAAVRGHLRALVSAGLVTVDRSCRPPLFRPVPNASRQLAHSVHSALTGSHNPADGSPAPTVDSPAPADGMRLRLLSRIAAQVGDGVALINPDGWLVYANPAFSAMHGYPDQDLAGRHFTAFLPPRGQQQTLSRLIADALQHGVARADTWRARCDGSVFPAAVTLSLLRDDHGQLLGRVLSVQDVTVRRQLEDQLREQALHDPLTGLGNRRLLLDRLQQALEDAGRTGRPVAVLFCDLDGFKQVNDRHGHQVGDQLLQHVAHRLTGPLRAHDTLARLGGDEFVVVLPGTDLPAAHQVAGRLHAALHPPLHLAGRALTVGLSIGVTADHAGTPSRLLAAADAAMYRDKTTRTTSHPAGHPAPRAAPETASAPPRMPVQLRPGA